MFLRIRICIFQETSPKESQPEQSNDAESEMDHQNSNSSNTAGRFARPMESGDNVERPIGNKSGSGVLYSHLNLGILQKFKYLIFIKLIHFVP